MISPLTALSYWLPPDSHTPCYGLGEVFSSVSRRDHDQAKRLCARCPVATRCREEAREEAREAGPYGYAAPMGTRGGELFMGPRFKVSEDRAGDEAAA